jgi:hypothetical protein
MKICSKCKQNKPFSEFSKKKDGYQGYCKSCVKIYYKGYYNSPKEKERIRKNNAALRKRKQDLIKTAKSVPCKDCGQTYPSYVMDFDHKKDKNFTIATHSKYSLKQIKEEIAKCDIVCANCHRERTHCGIV